MLSKRLGSRTLRRGAVSIVVGLLAVATMTSVAMARPVQAVTIAGQTPSPVIVGNTATFTVQYVGNPDGVAHGFAVTAVSGATGLSVVSGGCVSIPAYGMANLGLVQIGTTTATPTGVLPITLTVTEFASSLDCSSSSGNVGQTVATTLDTALPPLTVTMYKEICPSYSDVPANAHGSPDDTGGHAGEEKSGYSAKPITWDNSNAVGCALAPGWTFDFKNGQYGSVISQHVTGADGSVTVALNPTELALARSSTGLWVLEETSPSAPFGGIRCYMDAINDDNLEQITSVAYDVTQATCFAYNVAQYPKLTVTKTPSRSTYDGVGQTISYTYTLTNSGNVTLTGPFTITDVPLGTVTCSGASLAPGATIAATSCDSKTYITTQPDFDAAKTISDTATGHASLGTTAVDSTPVTVNVNAVGVQAPALTVVKSSDHPSYTLGDTITYSYKVTNTGNVTINAVSVSDDKLGAITACTATSLAPGGSMTCTATHVVSQADFEAGSITNTGSVTGTPVIGSLGAPATSQLTVTITGQAPALRLTKTATPTTFSHVGDVITYTFALTNSGNVTLTGPFAVTDPLATVDCSGAAATLAPGASTSCTGTHVVTQLNIDLGSITNFAVGRGQFGRRTVVSNIGTATVQAIQTVGLTLVKTADTSTYSLGQTIHYSYKLTNSGNVTIYRTYTVTDNKVSVSCPNTPIALAPGAFVTCTASHVATATDISNGSITNTATGHAHRTLLGQTIDSNAAQLTVTAAPAPAMTIVKSSDHPSYTVGDTITYSYKVTNTGNVTINNIVVNDDKLGIITCPDTSLAEGTSMTCTITHVAQAGEVGNLTNNVTLTGDPTGGSLDPASDSLTVVVNAATGSSSPSASESVAGETYTPPPTGTSSSGGPTGNSTPIFALLICLGFGALALVSVQAQRRSIKR